MESRPSPRPARADAVSSLYDWWVNATATETPRIIAAMPVPGRLSLRCRYELLAVGDTVGQPADLFAIGQDRWDAQIDAADRGDAALHANRPSEARRAFQELLDGHDPRLHPLPLVDAHIGLGDADRQDEEVPSAVQHYALALTKARACKYSYGEVRSAIPLGYLHLRIGAAGRALEEFIAAAELSRRHEWKLDLANALTGSGEAHHRLDAHLPALRALLEALDLFERLASTGGMANALVQLGEVSRRAGWLEEGDGWYSQAIDIATDLPIALANALDGRGEIRLALGDREAAIADHTAALAASQGYLRGQAHALNGMARCAFHGGEWQQSIGYFNRSAELYQQIDDLTSAASSETGLAMCHERSGDLTTSLRHRLNAATLIEKARATQIDHNQQSEYFERFGVVHEQALRTALLANDPRAFLAVFEAVAGRRLAGMMTAAPEDTGEARLLAQLVLEADARAGPRRELTRKLASIGLRATLPGLARNAFNDTVASLYSPFDIDEVDQLWERADTGDAYMLPITALRHSAELAWLLKSPEGPLHIGLTDLPTDCVERVKVLHARGLPLTATPRWVDALSPLMPPEVLAVVPPDAPLIVVPAGRLWAVPWPAIRLSPREFLGERNPLCLAASLTAVAHGSGGLRTPIGSRIAHWTSPGVTAHVLSALDERGQRLSDANACRSSLIHGEHDAVVVLSHGRPVRDLVHYLELDEHTALTPADMLKADPPPALALISCWGAHAPDQGWGDPLSIATLALARGSRGVAATTSELIDDVASSAFVNGFLDLLEQHPMPQALQLASRRWLARVDWRTSYLARWAPLVSLGTW